MKTPENKITIEKATLFISVAGLIMSLVLSELNRRANIELEEKKIESTLFLQAIQINNEQSTLENLKFLLKMGAISSEREKAIRALSDSIYLDATSQIYTRSDTVGFIDFRIMNNKKDKNISEQWIRGANIRIISVDSLIKFELSQYTDNYGYSEFYFPKAFQKKFTKVIIVKDGYKSKSLEIQLPDFKSITYLETIILEELK